MRKVTGITTGNISIIHRRVTGNELMSGWGGNEWFTDNGIIYGGITGGGAY